MIQLLLALAIVAILSFTLLGGEEAVEENPEQINKVISQRQTGVLKKNLEQSMQKAADQRMLEMDRQIKGN